jgi:hypothetical protein
MKTAILKVVEFAGAFASDKIWKSFRRLLAEANPSLPSRSNGGARHS